MKTKAKWVTRDGTSILIRDMSDDHIRNTLRLFAGHLRSKAADAACRMSEYACTTSADMASMYAELESEALFDLCSSDCVHELIGELAYLLEDRGRAQALGLISDEAIRRGIEVRLQMKSHIAPDWKVRAILEGATQLRVPVRPQPKYEHRLRVDEVGYLWTEDFRQVWHPSSHTQSSPLGIPGDEVWCKEAFQVWDCVGTECGGWPYEWDVFLDAIPRETPQCLLHPGQQGNGWAVLYRATCDEEGPWRSSTTMPRWASRLTLHIESVGVERLQEISREDAVAEGCPMPTQSGGMHPWPENQLAALWDSRYAGKGLGWEKNPWVWKYTFWRI